MSKLLRSYHGQWSLYNPKTKEYKDCSGVLHHYEDEGLQLEVYHSEEFGSVLYQTDSYDIVRGQDETGTLFTLEGLVLIKMEAFKKTTYQVRFALIGKHVESFDTKSFKTAIVHYPWLITWASYNRMNIDCKEKDVTTVRLDFSNDVGEILNTDIGEMDLVLWSRLNHYQERFNCRVEQSTMLNLNSHSSSSINEYLKAIARFTQFLSIALYKKQFPSSIVLKTGEEDEKYELLFKAEKSYEAKFFSVIKFNKLKDRIPSLLQKWYEGYDKISPIASYLVNSISHEGAFDSPDFLVVMQALEGYYKRFVHVQVGKKKTKNEEGLKQLLDRFKDVDVLKECDIDTAEVIQTRDYYTHLLPDGTKEKAITDSENLLWLTAKCKILLLCCILDYMGMTPEEIDTCCNESPVRSTLHFIKRNDEKRRRLAQASNKIDK